MANNTCGSEGICRIVSAYAARSDATVERIVDLYNKLSTGASPAARRPGENAPSPTADPAVPVSQAVSDDVVTCLCCGRGFKMLKRHLKAEHGLSEAEYRFRFALDERVPLVAPAYSRKKAEQAKASGLGRGAPHPLERSDESLPAE
jgi:predicted transcriptional regulator